MLNWCEIDAKALAGNVEQLRGRLVAEAAFGAVVKAEAYGHGMLPCARIAVGAGAGWLCVNGLDEGLALRAAGRREPILVLGFVERSRLADLAAADLRPTVYDLGTVERLAEVTGDRGRPLPLHVKLETGTHRQGAREEDLGGLVERVEAAPGLRLEGVSMHFANVEDTTRHDFALGQLDEFLRIANGVEARLGRTVMRHAASSAAALLYAQTHLDLVRVGISMYGEWPSRETLVSCRDRGESVRLTPVLTWKTRVAQVKPVEEGAFVGYGCTYRTTRPTRIAVLPVGYSEGYGRGLSNVGHVLVRGRRAPVRGRICMNMCMVDVTDVPGVEVEDEVVLLGRQGDEVVTAGQLAEWCGTISYEILARISPNLPRVVIGA